MRDEAPACSWPAIADTLQFLVNAGAYGKNLRVIARKTDNQGQ